ncbi:hypothetical protein BCLUESOX_2664 [bacterium endosymbiont of Bathymodiolus sp. 5 South]|nr:hypothetical protein [uncultured Gammaproteobacteria bacterium]SHN92636.1 hypothetical protein BCLUESOX_2657 [bacterium endosymbiont of Bathymodiolus sp. 5 South]SHN92647.1 hypothetical protein BCLUESOX_2664 [bacterium endosymbiont of Bathymodiolus sp. 5 South]VVH57078.1 hypothetical protein BSPCLSOX_1131 [uncultured Gammaproteobacteria bacterium]VVH63003.1 hypothetical protein BSPWISOX_1911 [uncultured Gammaproteobacteria bacterium]
MFLFMQRSHLLKVFSDTKKPSLLTGVFCIFNKARYLKD